jgi:hypothetical protein
MRLTETVLHRMKRCNLLSQQEYRFLVLVQ